MLFSLFLQLLVLFSPKSPTIRSNHPKWVFPRKDQEKASGPKTIGATAFNTTTVQLPLAKASESRKVVQFDMGLGLGNETGLGSSMSKSGFFVKPRLVCGLHKKVQTKEKGIRINDAASNHSAIQNGQQTVVVDKGKSVEKSWSSEDSGDSSNVESREGIQNLGGEPSMAGLNQMIGSNIVIELSGGGGGESGWRQNGGKFGDGFGWKVKEGLDKIRGGISGLNSVRGSWNLEVELTKAIEKGVEMGYFKFPNTNNKSGVATDGSSGNSASG
ncbi:hypothetical protein Q3G72_023503 [Acer saccharum]|nr:hypothetical protein Q3G72_023503 [Acer saccharum]